MKKVNATPEEVEKQKEKFEVGLRVRLIKRQNIHLPPINTTGVVRFVDDEGNVHVLFDEATCETAYYGLDELEVVNDYREEPYKIKLFKEMDELRIEEGVKNFLNIDYVKIEAMNYYLSTIITLIEEHPLKYLEYATEYITKNNIDL